MRASVELRVPFLDLRFFELVERMPSRYKVSTLGSRKWLSAFNSVAFVLLGIVLLSLPGALLGLLMRTNVGLALAGAIWPLVLAGGDHPVRTIGIVSGGVHTWHTRRRVSTRRQARRKRDITRG